MWHCSACYRRLIYFLVVGIVAIQANSDGSSPEEICPCQVEDSCQAPRHIFGRDPLDIQKFGLISPCRTNGEMPCCPEEPPPPKEVKLTPKDFEGFSPAELAELGVLNDTIGSASLPLAPQTALFNEIPPSWRVPVDLKQPGAASLAPAGATAPEPSQNIWAQQSPSRTPSPAPGSHPPNPMQSRPAFQPSAYRAPPASPMYQSPAYRPMPQAPAYRPLSQAPAYRPMSPAPAYSPMPQPPAYRPMPQPPAYQPMPQSPSYRPSYSPMYQPQQPHYPRPAYQPPYMPPPPSAYQYRMY